MLPISGATIVLVVLILLAVFTLSRGIRAVPQGEVWTIQRFGAFTRMLQPGLNFIIPYIDTVGHRMNVQEQVLDIPEQTVITRDNASVSVDGIVYFRVMDAAKAAYQVQFLARALEALSMTNIRAVIGEMDLDQTLSSRDRINSSLLAILDGATEPWGVKVNRIEIRKIDPPENLIRAMNLQMTAERERRATVAKAQGDREAAIQRAEGDKQARVLEAEGRLEAAARDAQARERLAEAEANATRLVSDAAAGAGADALRYFIAEKYVKAFETLAGNPAQKLVIVPMESSALAGGVAQALELLRAHTPPPPLRGRAGEGGATRDSLPAARPQLPPAEGSPWTQA